MAISQDQWAAYFTAREQGSSASAAARSAGFSVESALRFERTGKGSGAKAAQAIGLTRVGNLVIEPAYGKIPQQALDDFAYFRRHYFGRRSVPWQVDAANQVVAALADPGETKMVINAPPGTGKSTTFTHDIPCWLIARDRSIRIMLGSRTERQAVAYTRRIRNTLMRKTIMRASTKDLQTGSAADGKGVMAVDFGAFQPPDRQEIWRAHEFTVVQPDMELTDEKESTVTAYGFDSGYLGGRFDVVLWDDLVDLKNMRTDGMRAQLFDEWDTQAESRLEPGGVLILQGQRIMAEDLYRYCLDKKNDEGGPDYIHIKYQAHDEEKCLGHHHSQQPWPNSCLLDPKRLPWNKIAAIATNRPRIYQTVYQQEDQDAESALVDKLWLDGGTDPATYERFPGCYDKGRALGRVPDYFKDGSGWSVVTVDPSPTKYWGIQWWGYHPDTEARALCDAVVKTKLSSTQFLTMDLDTGVFSGIAEQWRAASVEQGFPIEMLIVEQNAAQRFMLQNPIWSRWLQTYSITLIPHDTHRNKTDPAYGVEGLQTPIKMGKYRFPNASDTNTQHAVERIRYELTHYPNAQDFDCVMAMWFFEHHLAKTWSPKQTHYMFERPGFLRDTPRGLYREKQNKPRLRIRVGGNA